MLRKTDRIGRTTAYSYDYLGNRTAENWLDYQGSVPHTISFSYDRLGELLSASDSGATDAYAYNGLGQVASVTQTIAGLTPSVTLVQQFDPLGGRSQLAAAIGDTADVVNSR